MSDSELLVAIEEQRRFDAAAGMLLGAVHLIESALEMAHVDDDVAEAISSEISEKLMTILREAKGLVEPDQDKPNGSVLVFRRSDK